MRIGVLTGGGDVPGLNACIKAIVRRSHELGWEVLGLRRGWAGPLQVNPQDPRSQIEAVLKLSPEYVRPIDRTGGTILHTSRTNPGKVKQKDVPNFLKGRFEVKDGLVDCTAHVLEALALLKVDALIPIGGDDTLSYAARLAKEGVTIISIPKTMDNDVYGTDYCIGFSTAVTRSVDFITALRTTAGSHERIGVIELFGRNSGETALMAGYLADADRVLIAEVPFHAERVAELLLKDRAANPSSYAMLVVSEGAQMAGGGTVERGEADAYGHRKLGGIGEIVGEEIKRLTGVGIISQSLAYLMRSGPPDSLDRMVATSYGIMAVQLLAKGRSGVMTAIRDGKYTTVPADTSVKGKRRVDVAALYDVDAYRPRIAEIDKMPMFLY
jgi:6-phosphofructokinase 1